MSFRFLLHYESLLKAHAFVVIAGFHGGGLLQGTKSGVAPHMRRAVDQYGIAVISVDYRVSISHVGSKDQ